MAARTASPSPTREEIAGNLHDGRARRATRKGKRGNYAETLDGLDVVGVDANAGDGDGFDAVAAAVEVGREALDDQLLLGQAAELADGGWS